jgi:hypothetical protein
MEIDGSVLLVHEIVARQVEVRSEASDSKEARTGLLLNKGQLVSIDAVLDTIVGSSTTDNASGLYATGPYLRLSDGSGWIFANKAVARGHAIQSISQAVAVDTSQLWVFYVDISSRDCISLQAHPNNASQSIATLTIMQKIQCDARVQSQTGVNWFRVQNRNGWVKEMEPLNDTDEDGRVVLLPEDHVQEGAFAYAVINPLGIRTAPNVRDDSKDPKQPTLVRGDVCLVDLIRSSPDHGMNGPFLRIPNGIGWVFEYKHRERIMQAVAMETGFWKLQLLTDTVVPCVGPILTAQRLDSLHNIHKRRDGDACWNKGDILQCDCRIQVSTNKNGTVLTTFYRVAQTDHWYSDNPRKRSVQLLLTDQVDKLRLSSLENSYSATAIAQNAATTIVPWTRSYVRGVLAILDGITELERDDDEQVMAFLVIVNATSNAVRMHVYLQTRTVVVIDNFGKRSHDNCTAKQLHEYFKNPTSLETNESNHYFTSDELAAAQCKPTLDNLKSVDNLICLNSTISHSNANLEEKMCHLQLECEQEFDCGSGSNVKRQESLERNDDLDSTLVKFDTRHFNSFRSRAHEHQSTNTASVALGKLAPPQHRVTIQSPYQALSSAATATSMIRFSEDNGSQSMEIPLAEKPGSRSLASEVNLTCGQCFDVFPNPRSRRWHCLQEHGLYSCNFCILLFKTADALSHHRDADDHW